MTPWTGGARDMFNETNIPHRTRQAIDSYVADHLPVGGFLMAVLSNDLKGAFNLADNENLQNLPAIVAYVINHIPADCWGSLQKVRLWLSS